MHLKKFKKFAAVALAMTLFVPALSSQVSAEEVEITTDFAVNSPVLTLNVPTSTSLTVNPFYDGSATAADGFSISTEDIYILNASTDVEKDMGIPVNVTVKAQITSKGAGVLTQYNDFTEDFSSTDKKVNLNLVESKTGVAAALISGKTAALDSTSKKLNIGDFEGSGADYKDSAVANKMTVTEYGAKISIDVAAPTSSVTPSGSTKAFSSDASKITPGASAFALVGKANPGADWSESDLAVKLVYDAKASNAVNVAVPTIATAPEFKLASPADVSIAVSDVKTATVTGVALHAPELSADDFAFEDYTVTYTEATVSGKTTTTAAIKIPKTNGILTAAAGLNKETTPYDLIVVLSDGRVVTTTLSVTGK